METTAFRIGDAVLLHLTGRMTAGRCGERLPHIVRRLPHRGVRRVVLDLAGVSYMDSSCLGEIIRAAEDLGRRGTRLELANVPSRVQRFLDLSRVPIATSRLPGRRARCEPSPPARSATPAST